MKRKTNKTWDVATCLPRATVRDYIAILIDAENRGETPSFKHAIDCEIYRYLNLATAKKPADKATVHDALDGIIAVVNQEIARVCGAN